MNPRSPPRRRCSNDRGLRRRWTPTARGEDAKSVEGELLRGGGASTAAAKPIEEYSLLRRVAAAAWARCTWRAHGRRLRAARGAQLLRRGVDPRTSASASAGAQHLARLNSRHCAPDRGGVGGEGLRTCDEYVAGDLDGIREIADLDVEARLKYDLRGGRSLRAPAAGGASRPKAFELMVANTAR